MKNTPLIVAAAIAAAASPLTAATIYQFTDTLGQSGGIMVEYWTGSGANETILIVDWNNSGSYNKESYAFGFRWDGTKSVSDMIRAIAANGGLDTSQSGDIAFLANLSYSDDVGEFHIHDRPGYWNLASTGDIHALWNPVMSSDGTKLGDWDANMGAATEEFLVDGQLEGINTLDGFGTGSQNMPLNVPFAVPEPTASAVAAMGGLLLIRRTRRRDA